VPPAPIRTLRDLTRTRTSITRARSAEIQRLEKLLEDAGIKLSSVATDITGVSSRAMLEAMIAGQHDPATLANLAKRRMRSKIPALTEALTGRFSEHHHLLTRLHLDLIDQHSAAIDELTARIEVVIAPFRHVRDLLITIPGISEAVADVVIAETGADMTRFSAAAHLASWAGTSPGSNESAGRVKSTHTRPGDPYLKGTLGVAAIEHRRPRHHQRLPRCQVPPGRLQARTHEGHRRGRARHPDRGLEHDHHPDHLPRPRSRLLHQAQPRQGPPTSHRPARQNGLRRHPQPSSASRGSVIFASDRSSGVKPCFSPA